MKKTLKFMLITLSLLQLAPAARATEPMALPIFLKYGLMQQVMLQAMFKGPGHSAVYRIDGSGCNTATFTHPQLSGINQLMQVQAQVLVKLSMPTGGKHCTGLKQWSGRAVVQGKPLIIGESAQAIQFKVEHTEIYDDHGKQLNSGLIAAALEGQLHPLLDQFKVDLKPQLQQLKSVLPFMLPGYSNEPDRPVDCQCADSKNSRTQRRLKHRGADGGGQAIFAEVFACFALMGCVFVVTAHLYDKG